MEKEVRVIEVDNPSGPLDIDLPICLGAAR